MDSFIKKIFEKKEMDEWVHGQFQKFSKGEFNDKAAFVIKNSKGKFTLNMAPDYGNELVKALAEELGNNKAEIEGALITTIDLSKEYDFKEVKNALGVRKHFIQGKMSGAKIMELQEKFPKAFFALSFKTPTSEVKIKVKAPKTKPSGKGDAKPKVDFCTLKTTNKKIVESFAFGIDIDKTKKAEITHDFIITDIIKPKGETDFSRIRELAKRQGKIIRKVTINDEKKTSETEFTA